MLNDYGMQHNAEVGLFTRPSTLFDGKAIALSSGPRTRFSIVN